MRSHPRPTRAPDRSTRLALLAPALTALMLALGLPIRAHAQGTGTTTSSTTFTSAVRDALVFATPTAVTQRTTQYATTIFAVLQGSGPGMPDQVLFQQFLTASYADAATQAALAAARQALLTAGVAPGQISGPTQTAASTTLLGASTTSIFTLGSSVAQPPVTTTTIGPATLTVGNISFCGPAVAALPGPAAPVCIASPETFVVQPGSMNIDVRSGTLYTINETRTTTNSYEIAETYTLFGRLAPVTTAPEPSSLALCATGLASVGACGWRRRRMTGTTGCPS